MAPTLNENIESSSQASISDAIIMSTPWELQDIIRDDYIEDIAKLPIDKQRAILEEWKIQDPKNIGIFDTIVRLKDKEVVKTKDEVVDRKNEVVDRKNEVVDRKKDSDIERIESQRKKLNEVNRAARLVNDSAEKIKQSIGNKYDAEIQSELKNDREKPETKQFLSTLGIEDVNNVPNDKKQVVQDILMARATTQVLLDNQKQILEDNPKLQKDIENLNSLRFTLGLSDSSNVAGLPKLLTDQPKSDREAITSTVNSLTKWAPDTMITRTGDRLTFQDPKNERYSYDIDMAKRPPQLSKSLGRLSISRDIVPLSREDQEKSDKKNQAEKQLKSSQDTLSHSKNDFWQIRRDEYVLQGENKADGTAPINLYSQYLGENRWNHTQYETLEQAYAQWDIAEKDKVSTLEQMWNLSESMRKDNAKKILDGTLIPTDREKITRMLEERKTRLDALKRSEESLARVDKKALEYTPVGWGTEQWEKDASESLSFLSELGLNNLGQQWFEEVMAAWNEKYQELNILHIDLSKNPKIDDTQKKTFREAIDKFTWGSSNRDAAFVVLAKQLTNISFRTNNWNSSGDKPLEKRVKFLFPN